MEKIGSLLFNWEGKVFNEIWKLIGADAAYIHEEKFGIQELMKDLDIMAFKMDKGNIYRGLVLRNECANSNYDTDFLYR